MCNKHILFLSTLPIFQSEPKHGLYEWQLYGLNGFGDKLTDKKHLVCNISSNIKQVKQQQCKKKKNNKNPQI